MRVGTSGSGTVGAMPPWSWWSKFLFVIALVNGALYVAQVLFGWPTVVRASIGIGAAALGMFFLGGGAGGTYILGQADARAVDHEDVERYMKDRRDGVAFGVRMILLGATIIAVTFLLP